MILKDHKRLKSQNTFEMTEKFDLEDKVSGKRGKGEQDDKKLLKATY